MKRHLVTSLTIALLFAGEANSTVFYSIETSRDELVLVDSETGAVTTLGSIGTDMRDTDLAVIDDVVYVVNSLFTDSIAQVLSLDPLGGILSLDTLNVGGTPVTHSEGLAAIEGELWACFHWSSPSPTASDALGRLSLSGDLTDVVSFVGIDSLADGDGLGRDPSGEFLWVDVNPPGLDDRLLVDVTRPPKPMFQRHTEQDGYLAINDVEFNAAGDSLWGIAGDGFLRLIAYPSFAILDSVAYDAGNVLLGLVGSTLLTDVASSAPSDPALHLSLYPNPATDRLVLDVAGHEGREKEDVRVVLYDPAGRRIWSRQTITGRVTWNMRNAAGHPVSPGIYFVKVSSGPEVVVRRFAVVR